MAKGSDEIGVRGSISGKVRIVGAAAPGGVRLPWANAVQCERSRNAAKPGIQDADFLPFDLQEGGKEYLNVCMKIAFLME
jgi:hypothetical protein